MQSRYRESQGAAPLPPAPHADRSLTSRPPRSFAGGTSAAPYHLVATIRPARAGALSGFKDAPVRRGITRPPAALRRPMGAADSPLRPVDQALIDRQNARSALITAIGSRMS